VAADGTHRLSLQDNHAQLQQRETADAVARLAAAKHGQAAVKAEAQELQASLVRM